MKHTAYLLLLALCLLLAACGPKEAVPDSSSAPGASSVPDVSQAEPDISVPDVSVPDGSSSQEEEEPLPPLTDADRASAQDAAFDYYLGTVFEVHSLTEIDTKAGEITFQVSCSKGGIPQDPDRTISLERKNGAWTVVSEGY